MQEINTKIINEIIDKRKRSLYPPLFINNSPLSTTNFTVGAVTPIYVKWLWLDKILCRIFKPFKKL